MMESDYDDRLKTKESDRNHLETVSDNAKLEDGNDHLVPSEKSDNIIITYDRGTEL